jgi:GNAT superfamily N-acetyltransferase
MNRLPDPGRVTVQDTPNRDAVDPAVLARLRAIHEEAFPPEERQYSIEYMVGRAGEPESVFRIIRFGERDAGYLYLELDPKASIAFLWYFAVDATLRNNGIGRLAITDTLAMLRRKHPLLRYALFEVHKPLRADDAAARDLDRRRIEFYRRLGAFWVRNVDYRIPAADRPSRSVTYDPMFFVLHGEVDVDEIRAGILEMARDNFDERPRDPRWTRLQNSLENLTIVAPADQSLLVSPAIEPTG